MRVKTVPRHRVIPNNTNVRSVSESVELKYERSDNSSPNNEDGMNESLKSSPDVPDMSDKFRAYNFQKFKHPEGSPPCNEVKKEIANYATEVLDMSDKDKCKMQPLCKNLHTRRLTADFSSCRNHAFSSRKSPNRVPPNDDNNNELPLNTKPINRSVAGPSSDESKVPCEENTTNVPIKDEDATKAVNLSTKDRYNHDEGDSRNADAESNDKLKDTFLYKIMTDPMFLENIQKNKQSKKYVCQFCKQQFANSDALADHMDVKKDESNQVVCCACKKTFAQKRYLRYHQRCHSERTKFTCYICTKKYTRLDNLTRHNAFHVNPDKFSCTFCEKTFARKDLLNKHLKCHDNKHRFFCEICQKYFKGPVTLYNHKKIFHSVT